MGAFVISLVILLLVLLLTGALGSVLLVSLKVIGWSIVAILVPALLWMLISAPFRPLTERFRKAQLTRKIQKRINDRRKLGYDTQNLENELQEALKIVNKDTEHLNEMRRNLGYDEKYKT
jgi:hypothetical protein